MRRFVLCFLALLAGVSLALARDITTLTGQTYRSVTVTRVEKAGISISHRDGVAFLDFSTLPADIRREFGYTEAGYSAARTTQKQQQEVALAYQRRVAVETAARQAEEQQRRAETQAAAALLAAQRAQAALAQQQSSIATRDYSTPGYTARDYGTERYTGGGYTGGTVQVSGYYRKDGTYVRPHTRRK